MNPRAVLAAVLARILSVPSTLASGSLCARSSGCMKQPDCEDAYCPGRAEGAALQRAMARQSRDRRAEAQC